jgi:hypothetical protein
MAEQNYNKLVAWILGAVLVLVGILGFVMTSPLLGIFEVSTTHNIVHLLTGAILIAGAAIDGGRNARLVNMVLGAVYLLVAVVGFAAPDLTNTLLSQAAGTALMTDNVLHLVLGVVLVGVAFIMKETTTMRTTTKM